MKVLTDEEFAFYRLKFPLSDTRAAVDDNLHSAKIFGKVGLYFHDGKELRNVIVHEKTVDINTMLYDGVKYIVLDHIIYVLEDYER